METPSNGVKNYVLIFSTGDEVLTGIVNFAKENKVQAAHFTAIGALNKAVMGWYDIQKKVYRHNRVDEQVELVSLIGDIAIGEDSLPIVHAHFSVGFSDGTVKGGHLIEAYTSPTVELFITVEPISLNKKFEEELGLKLINLN